MSVTGDVINFIQRHYTKDGSFSPFNGVDCECSIRPVDQDENMLEFRMVTSETPDEEPEFYKRQK